ncbi:MAG TPA: VOC family protein [Solirubrobacteraceae bacterium]|nr:VOC family protein [Solirubrobacteraceae bacterium]
MNQPASADTAAAIAPTVELATFGAVHLDVTDAARSLAFWRDLVGLQDLGQDVDGGLRLGTEEQTLLVLHPGAISPARRGHAGLYHLAIHLPTEAEFARVLARLFAHRTFMSPTDHVFSKAIYLDDPDHLGLEFTLETPERLRSMRITPRGPEVIDASGRRRSGRDPLDVQEVLGHLPDSDIERPLPAGTKIGHMHLHVGEIRASHAFYRDALGFIDANDFGSGVDLHAGGSFKHRMALNTWQGVGVSQPPAGTAGLRHFTIRFDTPERLAAALERVEGATPHGDGHLVRDPAGNAMILTH